MDPNLNTVRYADGVAISIRETLADKFVLVVALALKPKPEDATAP
jgi:hypothetical protein